MVEKMGVLENYVMAKVINLKTFCVKKNSLKNLK